MKKVLFLLFALPLFAYSRGREVINKADGIKPVRIIHLSQAGIADDADITPGSTSFGTNGTPKLQAVFNLNASGGSLVIHWDVATSIDAPIILHSNTHIIGYPGKGLILRSRSDCWMFRNAHLDTAKVLDSNIVIENLIVNGNGANNTKLLSEAKGGLITGIVFVGVRNWQLIDVQLVRHRAYASYFGNCHNGLISGGGVDAGTHRIGNTDGYHFGPGDGVLIENNRVRTGDDAWAFNSDDVVYPAGFPISYGSFRNYELMNVHLGTTEGEPSCYGFRALSAAHANNGGVIDGIDGTTEGYAVLLDNFSQGVLKHAGPGDIKNVSIKNVNVTFPLEPAMISTHALVVVNANCSNVAFSQLQAQGLPSGTPVIFFGRKKYTNVTVRRISALDAVNTKAIIKAGSIKGIRVRTGNFKWPHIFSRH